MTAVDPTDYIAFHSVATHGGFSAAARTIGQPKATLSKRVTKLERELGVQLLERSTRNLRLTDVGREVLRHAQSIVAAIHAAGVAADETRASPRGIVRVSCPQGLIQDFLSEIVPLYLRRFADVRVEMKELSRSADLVTDDIDLALRVRLVVEADAALIVRRFGRQAGILVAAPDWLSAGSSAIGVDDLVTVSTLAMSPDPWQLTGPENEARSIAIAPRLVTSNVDALRRAAMSGLGVALLPEHVCRQAIDQGTLEHILPEWRTELGTVYGVFSGNRAMTPALRSFIDFLAAEIGRRTRPL